MVIRVTTELELNYVINNDKWVILHLWKSVHCISIKNTFVNFGPLSTLMASMPSLSIFRRIIHEPQRVADFSKGEAFNLSGNCYCCG